MTAMTAAEKQRRYRERKAATEAADPVPTFLEGVLSDTARAVEAGTAEPYQLARSATAIEVLDRMSEVEEERPPLLMNMICLALGAVTEEDKARALASVEREFENWLRKTTPGLTGRIAKSNAVIEQNLRILEWAEGERTAGRSSAATLTQGLNACRRLLSARQAKGTTEQFRQFTAPRRVEALQLMTNGDI